MSIGVNGDRIVEMGANRGPVSIIAAIRTDDMPWEIPKGNRALAMALNGIYPFRTPSAGQARGIVP